MRFVFGSRRVRRGVSIDKYTLDRLLTAIYHVQ